MASCGGHGFDAFSAHGAALAEPPLTLCRALPGDVAPSSPALGSMTMSRSTSRLPLPLSDFSDVHKAGVCRAATFADAVGGRQAAVAALLAARMGLLLCTRLRGPAFGDALFDMTLCRAAFVGPVPAAEGWVSNSHVLRFVPRAPTIHTDVAGWGGGA